jgi:hypothetical protein
VAAQHSRKLYSRVLITAMTSVVDVICRPSRPPDPEKETPVAAGVSGDAHQDDIDAHADSNTTGGEQPADLARVTNAEFAQFILGDTVGWFTSFTEYPSGEDRCWKGYSGGAAKAPTNPLSNNYMVISSIRDPKLGRTGENVAAVHALIIDDVGTKVAMDVAQRWSRPSAIIETSPGNAQWWYALATPITDLDLAKRILTAMRGQKVTDPGATVLTQYARLPVGTNSKPDYPDKPPTTLMEFGRERYTADEFIEAIGLVLSEIEGSTGVGNGRMPDITTENVIDLLAQIPNDGEGLPWDQYKRIAMAVKHQLGDEGKGIFFKWARRSSKFDEGVTQRDWRGIKNTADNCVTLRSIYWDYQVPVPSVPMNLGELPDQTIDQNKPRASRFTVITPEDFVANPVGPDLIKRVLPATGTAMLFGPSGSGKSFVAIDMALAVVRGIPWRGQRTRQGRVAYVVAEGGAGFRKRLTAYVQHQGIPLADLNGVFGVIAAPPNLLAPSDVDDVITALKEFGGAQLIVLDTYAKCTPGADENSGEDMGRALGHCEQIQAATGGLVLLIHHTGKDLSKGARGWSGIKAAMDAQLEVSRDGDSKLRKVRNDKQKDEEDGQEWPFQLEVVHLGVDEDLDPITSCVVDWMTPSQVAEAEPLERMPPGLYMTVDSLLTVSLGGRRVPIQQWRDEFYRRHTGDTSAKRQAFNRAKGKLVSSGVLVEDGLHAELVDGRAPWRGWRELIRRHEDYDLA